MISRRALLRGSFATLGATLAAACGRGPIIRTSRPSVTHGVQSGDPQTNEALVWARCDESARMIVEWDTTDRFANPRRVAGRVVTPDSDRCGVLRIAGLPAGQTIVYRVRFDREAERGTSPWVKGSLRTPHADRVRVAWTGDTCGQGFGRNPDFGGLRGFAAIRKMQPDVFVNSGDIIYADDPIPATVKLAGGRVWRNITNERVARVAESLDDFRARYAYNLEDEHVRALASEVPTIAQWDDHETHNNWWPGQVFGDKRYRDKHASRLAAKGRRAMFEWVPLRSTSTIHRTIHYGPLLDIFVLDCRSFRSPNTKNLDREAMLGNEQATWLTHELTRSTATWKLIACDSPMSVSIGSGRGTMEGFANQDPGPARGRELEIEALLRAIKAIHDTSTAVAKTVVWITADVHYAAAHHLDPSRAAVPGFDPFWEFIAGPIHAGSTRPKPLDATFGPAVKFQWGNPPNARMLSPLEGKQSFGLIDVTRDALTVSLRDIDDHELYKVDIPRR